MLENAEVLPILFFLRTTYKDVNTTSGSSFFKTMMSVAGVCFSDAKNNLASSIGK